MATFISCRTNAEAWLKAMELLLGCEGGKDFNVIISIQHPCVEISEATYVPVQLEMEKAFPQ